MLRVIRGRILYQVKSRVRGLFVIKCRLVIRFRARIAFMTPHLHQHPLPPEVDLGLIRVNGARYKFVYFVFETIFT